MATLTISRDIYRRFILGRTGLWPGRRFAGREGVAQAIRAAEFIQIDPISVIHRSHDLALWGRVAEYSPELLNQVMFEDRAFFDWGGNLQIHPMEQLPYWRVAMERRKDSPRWQRMVADSAGVIDDVRAALRDRGPLGNRDFESSHYKLGTGYRTGKLTGFALYAMWLAGEVMTHSRRGFDRIYDFTENVAPKEHQWIASEEEADRFFTRHAIALKGMSDAKALRLWVSEMHNRYPSFAELQQQFDTMQDSGEIVKVQVEGLKGPFYMLGEDQPHLDDLLAGRIPAAWQPVGPTTSDEVTFLAPLDIVSARGRAKPIFDFEYIWEVYKPAEKRRWGYYVLPVLYGDKLVARIDPKLDRKTKTLHILGFWAEDGFDAHDPAFVTAFGRGLANFAQFHEAASVNLDGIADAKLRSAVRDVLSQHQVKDKPQ